MPAKKDITTGTWLIQYRYTNWKGERKKSTKRGFKTKREAEEWLKAFLEKQKRSVDINFEQFVGIYFDDMEGRLRESTIRNKRYIVDDKIIPYFRNKTLSEISAPDIRLWQKSLMGEGFSQTYLKTINNQLSALFNYAIRFYDLQTNPCRKAGSIGRSRADEMHFWVKDEFDRFIDALMDKQISYVAFMILYWTGMRMGELLALTPKDIDIQGLTISINKSYQRFDCRDVITPPKTPKSNRTISIPEFLAEDLQCYFDNHYGKIDDDTRILPITKSYLEHEMIRGVQASGVKKIRLHDLRHSHASLLVEMGFTPLEIADRLGHDKIETTLNTYSHLYPNKQAELASKLNDKYKEDR